ncbi:hypothetical protein [Hymenobacter sp. BRD67]|uniref:hypothetical protein n=1 Tax=Hymenobacter sp. BRD67 TaxID=2675877 RepID=UPI001565D7CD|nr:hypothetical protein [Hymenobacter sp. BRD67]QKG55105.1 hypothetical protein GKZ67_22040 [Hymenobacter sp. BRD67]
MISQVLIQAGRLLLDEAPASARRFVDATNTGEIEHLEAKHLLTAYMRLRSVGKAVATTEEPESTDDIIANLPDDYTPEHSND